MQSAQYRVCVLFPVRPQVSQVFDWHAGECTLSTINAPISENMKSSLWHINMMKLYSYVRYSLGYGQNKSYNSNCDNKTKTPDECRLIPIWSSVHEMKWLMMNQMRACWKRSFHKKYFKVKSYWIIQGCTHARSHEMRNVYQRQTIICFVDEEWNPKINV